MQILPDRSLLGQPAQYETGLVDLGGGLWAWLQPNGGLGESNAGLVVGDGESLLIDTLWELRLTRRMLAAMADLTASAPIARVVNTHADGDHCWGNQLLTGTRIVATATAAEDMLSEDPRGARLLSRVGSAMTWLDRLKVARKRGGLGAFIRMLAAYDFRAIVVTPPTETFAGTLELEVGGRRLELIEAGPAHTPGDLFVHVPNEGVVFAGDLVFVDVTPIMWVGPVENWVAGLDRIIAIEPRLVVPGHGPITDLGGVKAIRAYWEFAAAGVRERLASGLAPDAAARDLVRSREFRDQPFATWHAPERIAINAAMVARSDAGHRGRVSARERVRLLARMGELGAELVR